MGLRREVIDLIGLHFLDDADQVGAVRQVAVMQDKAAVFRVRAFIEMVNARAVEGR